VLLEAKRMHRQTGLGPFLPDLQQM
jgi:hypothetical protein